MYGLNELRENLIVTESTVQCPVRDCLTVVDRQRRVFRREESFFCGDHQIYISPSTFEHENESANILWDYGFLEEHMGSKRESRIARDNSEDAVTWNVFRYLERQGLLSSFLSEFSGMQLKGAQSFYWSHDLKAGKPWEPLWEARKVFEGNPYRGSEPDLIVLADKILFFIEAKVTASNKTKPSRSNHPKQYVSGANGWWNHAFVPSADYIQIAEKEQKYELMRFWLLGTWMAKQLERDFMLINLVREMAEVDIESRFRKWLPGGMADNFRRLSWERISRFIASNSKPGSEKRQSISYFENKTVGYRKAGDAWKIQKAFSI
jgi:hypothetical protein